MGAKIFISWSGELSKALGEAVRDWIPKVLQSVKPYFTPDDIEKGARWAKDIGEELAASQLGIICLTQENQHNPWILFEAGALSKNLEESKVCPILFNFDTAELKGPLSSFQSTKFSKDDFKKLIESINNSCSESKLDEKSLEETFEMWWPKLDEKINGILNQEKKSSKPVKRDTRDILEEILDLTRSNAKSILSEQRNISPITVEELMLCYRRIKDKSSNGGSLDIDLAQMESTIQRLCKEGNFEDIYARYRRTRPYHIGDDVYMYKDKNSARESGTFSLKRRFEDYAGIVDKTKI